jgi:hypothetical protein
MAPKVRRGGLKTDKRLEPTPGPTATRSFVRGTTNEEAAAHPAQNYGGLARRTRLSLPLSANGQVKRPR